MIAGHDDVDRGGELDVQIFRRSTGVFLAGGMPRSVRTSPG